MTSKLGLYFKTLSRGIILMTLLASQSSEARRRFLSMSEYIKVSELIVVGAVTDPNNGVLNVQVKKVLKGKASFKNRTINLVKPGGKITVTSAVPIIHLGDEVAVLFETGWKESEFSYWPVNVTYKKEHVKSLKALINTLNK